MSFRDDREALLQRADATEREANRLRKELKDATAARQAEARESVVLQGELEALRRERDALAKRLDVRPDSKPDSKKKASARSRTWLLVAALGALSLAGALAFFLTAGREDNGARATHPAPLRERPVPTPPAPLAARPRPATPRQATPAAPAPAELARRELAACMACLDGLDLQLRAGWEQYRSWVRRGGRRFDGFRGMSIYNTSMLPHCRAGLDAPAAAPAGLLGAPAAFRKAALELATVASEVSRYYKLGDYKDDAYARGKTLHARLEQAHATYIGLSDPARRRAASARAKHEGDERALARTPQQRLLSAARALADAMVLPDVHPSLDQAVAAFDQVVLQTSTTKGWLVRSNVTDQILLRAKAERRARSRQRPGPAGPARREAGPAGPARREAGPAGPARREAGPAGPARREARPAGPARREAGPAGTLGGFVAYYQILLASLGVLPFPRF